MRTPALRFTALVAGLLASFSGCLCQPTDYVLVDNFASDDDGNTEDQLHTYAAGSRVRFTVVRSLIDDAKLSIDLGGVFSRCTECDAEDDEESNSVTANVGVAGIGSVGVSGEDGDTIGEVRELDVKTVDEIVLAVTAPLGPNLELPIIDPSNIRVWVDPVSTAPTKVALRSSLFAGGDEVFGLNLVNATSESLNFTQRQCTACAETGCDADRSGIEFAVSSLATDPIAVLVTAGEVRLAVTLVPTGGAEVTDVVLDESGVIDEEKSVVAHVLAADEPVFGVPVFWTVDGADVKDADGNIQRGDALKYSTSATPHDVVAGIGGLSAPASVLGDDFSVTAITFACGSAPGAVAPVVAVLGLLLLRRRQRS